MLSSRSLPTCAAVALLAACTAAADEFSFRSDSPWVTTARPTRTTPRFRLVQDAEDVTGVLFFWPSSKEAEGGTPGRDEPLASDRPDFTEASCTVGAGVVQIEMGYTVFYDDGDNRVVTHSFPETLYRIGVCEDWLELRVGWSYLSETTTVGNLSDTASGSLDLYLGVKFGLTPQQGLLPEMALVPQMLVPVGGPFSNDRVLPGINWLYGWDFTEFLSAGASTQINLRVDDGTGDTYPEFAQSWTFGFTFTKKLGGYAEWFILSPIDADTARTQHYLDGGFTYKVTNDLQLDIRAGKGVSSAAADFFSGIGAVVRF
jgi:hypothetical protein